MFPPFEPMAAARPFEPTLQRGQYARQRMMTLGDLLLETIRLLRENPEVLRFFAAVGWRLERALRPGRAEALRDEARRTYNLNLANWIPDVFMRRVDEDGMWSLFDPTDRSHGRKITSAVLHRS